jgi:hypothetical protein
MFRLPTPVAQPSGDPLRDPKLAQRSVYAPTPSVKFCALGGKQLKTKSAILEDDRGVETGSFDLSLYGVSVLGNERECEWWQSELACSSELSRVGCKSFSSPFVFVQIPSDHYLQALSERLRPLNTMPRSDQQCAPRPDRHTGTLLARRWEAAARANLL